MSAGHGTAQPFLHDLVSCVRAPFVGISRADGQLRALGADGVYDGDTRVLSRCEVTVDGVEAEPLGHALVGVGSAEFVGVVRHLGDSIPDPTVTLTRTRIVDASGMREVLGLRSTAQTDVRTTVDVMLGVDLALMSLVKSGVGSTVDRLDPEHAEDGLLWRRGARDVRVVAYPTPDKVDVDAQSLRWDVELPARGRIELVLRLSTANTSAERAFRPVAADWASTWSVPTVTAGDPRLMELLDQSLLDAQSLLLGDPEQPEDCFLAAGSPWFLTLFGRDSLWAARMMLPLGTDLARGTLASLARRQGKRVDPATEEQPGKILHEVREHPMEIPGEVSLPALYYGTVDATPLWVCLLVDAWRWGMPAEQVEHFLPACEAALRWIVEHGDSDGDGFLEYIDSTGSGLANQGWKDSGDSIQWADGRLATGPLALCEVQAYAYQAATGGADLLEAFGRPGTDRWREWAVQLRRRFRSTFWTEDADGFYPAVALDGGKARVDSLTSNIGHLLGTGLLDDSESAAVAQRLGSSHMDSGYGLRTLTATAPRFGPLSYHGGTVWPHDTAIAVAGLVRSGQHDVAASLVSGILAAAPRFDYRLPELYSGTQREAGRPLLAYPAACRPQAWAAATAVSLLQSVLGVDADVPGGSVTVAPLRPLVTGPISALGLRLRDEELSIAVAEDGTVDVTAPRDITVKTDLRAT